MFFYDGTGATIKPDVPNPPIVFQGRSYSPMPIQIKGFEFKSKGELPRPIVRFSNVMGAFTSLTLAYDDLVGAKIIRKRTLRKFLDDGIEPNAAAELPEDIFFIERKSIENKLVVEFELGTPLDLEGVILPKRQILANICGWRYRSPECSFSGNRFVADASNKTGPDRLPLVRFTGEHSLSKTYTSGLCVSYTLSNGEVWYYQFIPTSGNAPITSASWVLIQRYRGEWKAKNPEGFDISYYTDDVVFVTKRGIRQFFLFVSTTAAGDASEPPNLNMWRPDSCGKMLTSCKLRFDPLVQNIPLPYGAFPGTSRVPDL